MVRIGRAHEPFDDVREIAILRGGGIGDLMFALPAIDALAATYPHARITLLGAPVARALLAGRPGPIDSVEVVPVMPGLREGTAGADDETAEGFVDRLAGRFDLLVQAHGGGRNSNPFAVRFGARHTVGTATADAELLERWVRYEYYQHEVIRWLEVVGLAGAAATTVDPALAVADRELVSARILLERALRASSPNATPSPDGVLDARTIVVMHPGASDPRRRWPADRFAQVARERIAQGDLVVLVGDASDRPAADAIHAALHGMGARRQGRDPGAIVDFVGALRIDELPGVLATADIVVANDSGPRHLAVAVGTPTVGVFWFGNVINAGPFDRARHRVLMSFVSRCPVCGIDVTQVGWTVERCEHNPSFVEEVRSEAVLEQIDDLLQTR